MAEKILSQGEIEALIKGVQQGNVDINPAGAPISGTRPYDLTSQERIIRGRMPSLEIINERFARLFQVSISSFMRKEAEFVPVSVEITKFGEFMRKIPLPSNINVVKMDPLRGHILVVLDAKVVYRIVDLYFGGSGQTHVKIEGRDFTPIEQRIIRKLADAILQDLQKAWTPVHPVKISFIRAEINPQFASVVAPTEVVVTVTFKLEIDGAGGEIFVCLPYPTIEPIREKLYGSFQSDQLEVDRQWTERFRAQLFDCRLPVTVEIGTAILMVQEIRDLSVGDIVVLDKGVNDDFELKVEGRTLFHGRPGIHQGRPAFQVASIVRGQEEERHGE